MCRNLWKSSTSEHQKLRGLGGLAEVSDNFELFMKIEREIQSKYVSDDSEDRCVSVDEEENEKEDG